MISIGTVVVGVTDVRRAVDFWSRALDYVLRDGEISADGTVLVPAEGHGVGVNITYSETPPQPHPRTHLDLYTNDAAEQAAEVERLVSLGAEHVDWELYPADPEFVVLADPEGNRFCVIDTSHG